jgi:flavodoxin
MKAIVVYYSRSGNTKKLGNFISDSLACPAEEIIDLTNRTGVMGYLNGGRDAMQRKLTQIKPTVQDFSKFDLVIIGTPVWASNMTPAIRTFLTQNKGLLKKVAFFCTAGGKNEGATFKEMKLLSLVPKATLLLTTQEMQTGKFVEKANEFVKTLKQ